MKRFGKLLPVLFLLMLLPYGVSAETVDAGELMEIEKSWEIEDSCQESDALLVSGMQMNGQPMGLDSASQTFYCYIGMTEDWPDMKITAEAPDGTQVGWLDDYHYDGSADSVRDGIRYELMAWNGESYNYFGVVFTGLPMVIVDTEGQEIPYHDDVEGSVCVLGGEEAVSDSILVHERGSGYDHGIDKKSYKIELTGEKQALLGMPEDTEWNLLANATDVSCIRNIVCWDLWSDWNGGQGTTVLQNRLTEVFINNEYEGIYQLGQHINVKKELKAMGGSLDTDAVVRKMQHQHPITRPVWNTGDGMGYLAELRFAPKGMESEQAFEMFRDYVQMELHEDELDDETFIRMAEEHFDMEPLMRYFLFIQVCSVGLDNTRNNVFIWALHDENGNIRYRLSPWDLDCAFQRVMKNEDVTKDEINLWMTMINRILTLNVAGSREALWKVWQEERESAVKDGVLYDRITAYGDLLTETGAYARETERWRDGAQEIDLSEIRVLAEEHLETIESYITELWPLEAQ